MKQLTVSLTDDANWRALAARASRNGRSIDGEAQAILLKALEQHAVPSTILDAREKFCSLGGIELPLPPRTARRVLPLLE